MLASKVDVLFQKVNRFQPTPSQGGAPSGLHGQVSVCEVRGIQGNNGSKCHLDHLSQQLTVEQANTLYSFNARAHNEPYSNTYNPGGITQIFPTKIQIFVLTIPHKIILILPVFNAVSLLNFNLYNPISKI